MLQRAVRGVCRQRHQDFEMLVIDDASDEDTIDAIALEDPRIRLFRNETQLGPAGARNVGINAARGAYISFLDDDDEWLDSFLSSTLECLRQAPANVALSWCGVKQLHYPRHPSDTYFVQLDTFAAGARDAASALDDLMCIGTGFGVTVKTECLREMGGFNPALKTVEDLDLFLRLVEAGFTVIAIPSVHVVVHNHTMPRLTDPSLHALRIQECQWILSQYATLLETHSRVRAKLLDHIRLLQIELDNPQIQIGCADLAHPGRRFGWPSMSRWSNQSATSASGNVQF
jgi:glycosyltransferase involved in cell wall biosynthesis